MRNVARNASDLIVLLFLAIAAVGALMLAHSVAATPESSAPVMVPAVSVTTCSLDCPVIDAVAAPVR